MSITSRRYTLLPVSLIWLGVIVTAMFAGWLRQMELNQIWPIAAISSAPAIVGLLLTPVMHREWAQIIVILGWLALAVIAVLGVSFVPMAILFMCAPAAAALFERDKVIEAMVMAAILAAILFYAGQQGVIPDGLADERVKDWGQKMGIFATLAFLVGSLMTTAQNRGATMDVQTSEANQSPKQIQGDVFDVFPGNFFLLNDKNHVVTMNKNAQNNFELISDMGTEFISMIGLDNAARKSVMDLISRSRKVNAERSGDFLIRRSANVVEYLRFTVAPAGDNKMALSVFEHNESYRKIQNLQRQREKARKDIAEKSLFFAGVSHELRTPLNAIIGFSDMMRSRLFGPLPSKYSEYADMIHDSGQHMLDLLGDVLDIGKLDAGKYELKYDTFQAEDIIRSSLKMIRPAADLAEVALEAAVSSDGDLLVEADRRALRQILLNLLSNAVKFSPKGSIITTSAKRMGPYLRMTVSDQGEGMSAELVENIGQAYLQNADDNMMEIRGTGLGLKLVKSLVDLHNGKMVVDSRIGEGTTIHIDLPFERQVFG
ncbi:MAG: HAMP domain-containing sensor histidine kinase [Maricaulaceae bacterium]